MATSTIKFATDKAGNSYPIDLDSSVLGTDISDPQGKVTTDTAVHDALEDFESEHIIDDTAFTSSTKVPTGRSVATYVQNAVSGSTGGYLGSMLCADINAMTSHNKGDSVTCADAGTINDGEGGVAFQVQQYDEIAWTTGNFWVLKQQPYVRPSEYATTSRGGTLVSNSTSGNIVVDSTTGYGTVSGWDDKIDNSRSGLETLLTNAVDLGQGQSINDTDVLYTKNSATTYATKFTLSRFWDWIKDKISDVLGLDENEYDGNSATATEATSSYNLYAKDVNGVTSYILTDANLARSDIYLFNDGVAPTDRFQCNASQLVITQSYHFHFPFGGTLRVNNNTGSTLKIRWNGEETIISNGSYYDFVANENGIVSLLHAWSNCILGASPINSDKVDGYHIDVVTSGSISTETDHITFLKYTS